MRGTSFSYGCFLEIRNFKGEKVKNPAKPPPPAQFFTKFTNQTIQTRFRKSRSKVARDTRKFHAHDTQTNHRVFKSYSRILQNYLIHPSHYISYNYIIFKTKKITNNKVLFYPNIQRIYYNLFNEIYSINFIYTNKQEGKNEIYFAIISVMLRGIRKRSNIQRSRQNHQQQRC